MIKLFDGPADRYGRAFPPCLTAPGEALLAAYGNARPFFTAWETPGGILFQLDGRCTLCAGKSPDFEELAAFLRALPGGVSVLGREDEMKTLAQFLGLSPKPVGITMCLCGAGKEIPPFAGAQNPTEMAGLKKIYEILTLGGAATVPGKFEPWYCDLSHRIRHGAARTWLSLGGESCCIAAALTEKSGYLAGVATRPEARGRGIASSLVVVACGELLSQGRLPVLRCAEGTAGFYERMGFRKGFRIAEIRLHKDSASN